MYLTIGTIACARGLWGRQSGRNAPRVGEKAGRGPRGDSLRGSFAEMVAPLRPLPRFGCGSGLAAPGDGDDDNFNELSFVTFFVLVYGTITRSRYDYARGHAGLK